MQPHLVDAEHAGTTLASALRRAEPGLAWSKARALCERGKVRLNGELALDPSRRLAEGDRIELDRGAPDARVRPRETPARSDGAPRRSSAAHSSSDKIHVACYDPPRFAGGRFVRYEYPLDATEALFAASTDGVACNAFGELSVPPPDSDMVGVSYLAEDRGRDHLASQCRAGDPVHAEAADRSGRPERAVAQVDQRLYQAKDGGRNRVC